jgi:hypothetical protein
VVGSERNRAGIVQRRTIFLPNKVLIQQEELLSKVFYDIGAIIWWGLVLFVAALVNGWALSTLWGWFIVPLGIRGVTIAEAVGLTLVLSVLHGYRKGSPVDTFTWISGFFHPFFIVFLGWIVKTYFVG